MRSLKQLSFMSYCVVIKTANDGGNNNRAKVKNDGSGISPNTFEPLSLSKAVLKAAAKGVSNGSTNDVCVTSAITSIAVRKWAFRHFTLCQMRNHRISRGQLVQQRLCLLQIKRVEPLSEPPVNRSKQFRRLLHLALIAPESGEAHGGAEFPGFCLLPARDYPSAPELGFCLRR